MENVKIEINMNELLELAERCGNYYTDNEALLNENTKLKAQIKHLKFALMDCAFINSGKKTLDPTDYFVSDDLVRFIKCGITHDEIIQYMEVKLDQIEREKADDQR